MSIPPSERPKPPLPPYIPGDGGILVVMAGDGYRSVTKVPSWEAERLFKQGQAKPAVIRILYPSSWPLQAEVQYGDDVVVIERLPGPSDKPPENPYLPSYGRS